MALIENQRNLFEIPDDIHYLNCAYMSPLLKQASKAGQNGIKVKESPWKITPPDFFKQSDQARSLFSSLINANTHDIALIPAVSYGTAIAAINLPLEKDQKVLVLADEFPSNLYAWRVKASQQGASIKTVSRPTDNDWTSAVLEALDDQVQIVILPHTHWADGGQLKLLEIAEVLRKKGCALVLDVTQSLGVVSLDVQTIKPDFLICATYKWLLGPYSMGFLYADSKYQQTGTPLEQGWINRPGAENFSRLVDYTDSLNPDASRFDMGERSNFQLLPVVISALEQIHDWGQANIESSLNHYASELLESLMALGFTSYNKAFRSPHYLGIQHPDGLPDNLLKVLSDKQIYISQRGDWLRITPHLYNHEEDAHALIAALACIHA